MKIRSWLLLSYLCIIVFILLAAFIGSSVLLNSLHSHYTRSSDNLAQAINQENYRLAEDVLTHYGERVVSLQVDSLRFQLGESLKRVGMSNLQQLRELATTPIFARGEQVGYFGVMNDKGDYLLHPHRDVEGRNLESDRDAFPELYALMKRSQSEPSVQGYYSYELGGQTRQKFMAIRPIPGYPHLRLLATVNIDEYFLPVQNDIREAQEAVSLSAEVSFQNDYDRFIGRLRVIGVVVAAALLAVSMLVSTLFANAITRPLQALSDRFLHMAEGDFTTLASEEGALEARQLAASYNTLRERVGSLLKQVQRSGIQLMSASTEIAATARQQERTVSDFGAATNQIVTAAKEISATSQELVRTMGEVSDSSRQTATGADEGRKSIDSVKSRMDNVTSATRTVAERLTLITDHARDISSVVDTIAKVADQTNLLSLNAAIEAEKAGEVGLGFAVVAREIRRLADQTAVATLDIEKTVRRMQESVQSGAQEMDRFTTLVRDSVNDTSQLGARLETIIEEVQRLQPRFESVNEGMQMQSQGAGQISQAMVMLNENARQTAESVSEFNKATQQLKDAAMNLQKETKFFRVES